jgi:hypothetical protein
VLVSLMATGAILMGSLQTADRFWAAQGQPVPCPAAWSVWDDPDNSIKARAGIGWCGGLQFEADYVRYVSEIPSLGRWSARADLIDLCVVATHERGHELSPYGYLGIDGSGHEESGILSEYLDNIRPPGACVSWAQSLTKRVKRKARHSKPSAVRRPNG